MSLYSLGEELFYEPFRRDALSGAIASTGRENRDFSVVFGAADGLDVNLKLYVNRAPVVGPGCHSTAGIKIHEGQWKYKDLLKNINSSKCMIIPLKRENIDYCVGLTSLIDALALGRPIIATYNPYWYIDIEKEGVGIFIRDGTPESWRAAFTKINNNQNLVELMAFNARRIFNEKCNFSITKTLLTVHIRKLFL